MYYERFLRLKPMDGHECEWCGCTGSVFVEAVSSWGDLHGNYESIDAWGWLCGGCSGEAVAMYLLEPARFFQKTRSQREPQGVSYAAQQR